MPRAAPKHGARAPGARRHDPRAKTAARGYGGRWQRARAFYLKRHPLCVRCLEDGRTTTATQVDHVTPHRGDYALMWDRDNWQSLCAACHSRKTAREDGGFGHARAPSELSRAADTAENGGE